jgi:hypothetical protein
LGREKTGERAIGIGGNAGRGRAWIDGLETWRATDRRAVRGLLGSIARMLSGSLD